MSKRFSPISRTVVLLISSFFLVAPLLSTQTIQAANDRISVTGSFEMNNQTTNCNSPIGICLSGKISGNLLNGTVSAQANTIQEVDDNSGNPIAYILTGAASITTTHGTLTGNAYFYQDYPALTSHGTLTITGGTKRYKKTTGTLTINEPTPPTTFPDGVQTFYYNGSLSKDAGDNGNN